MTELLLVPALLWLGQLEFYAAIGALLWMQHKRNLVTNLMLLGSSCILINVMLKVTFKIPLPEFLHSTWYAFPSGHLQLATVIYGLLWLDSPKRWLQVLLPVVVTLNALAVWAHGFHTVTELVAGIVVGLILLGLYQNSSPRTQNFTYLALIPTSMLYIYWQDGKIISHAWQAAMVLGCITASKTFSLSATRECN